MRAQSERPSNLTRALLALAVMPWLTACGQTLTLGIPELGVLLQSTVGGALWAIANFVYFNMKRKGIRGFARFLAFWFGTPTTWVTFFILPEGDVPVIEPPPDDDATLLSEVRRDRMLRAAAGTEVRGGKPHAEEEGQTSSHRDDAPSGREGAAQDRA